MRWIVVAALVVLAVAGPPLAGTAETPSTAAAQAQLLAPRSRVTDLELEGGGFVRAPSVTVDADAIVLVRDGEVRRLAHVRPSDSPRERVMWLGTDAQGRDVLARTVHGARRSLSLALLAAVLGVALGAAVGLTAAAGPRWIATLVHLATDALLALPRLLLLLALGVALRGVEGGLVLAIGLASWMEIAWIVEGDVRSWLASPAAAAAKASGAGGVRLASRHLLPSVAPLLAVAVPAVACEAVVLEATLSYLGAAAAGDASSWGRMVADGQRLLPDGWWIALFPGVLLVATAFALNRLGARLAGAGSVNG